MKRFFLLILLIISISTLCSCSHIEDKNGIEDYSLTTISKQDILDNKYSQIKSNSIMNSSNNKITFTVKKFSGEELIKTFNLSNKTMTFTSNIKLYSGNLRIVLCSNDRILKDFSMSVCFEYKLPGQSICNIVLFYYLLLLQLYFYVFEYLFRIFLYFRLIALKEAQVTYTKKKLLIQNHLRLFLQSQN